MGRDQVTLNTVARTVGVSRSTVSNAYNRPDQLSVELRRRILDAAAELGYAGPDPAARSLRQGRAGAIGVVQGLRYAITDPANGQMLSGVAEVCEEHGLALVLIPTERPGTHGADLLRTTMLDGVIAHGEAFSRQRRKLIADRRLPFVTIDAAVEPAEDFVGIDDTGGALEAARHLLDLGHRRIAVFSLRSSESAVWVSDRRLEGYRTACADAGLPASGMPVVDLGCSTPRREAMAPIRAYLARHLDDRPTAVLAMSDELAAATIEVAAELGLRVPDDLSIVGYDDSPIAEVLGLTTVHQDHAAKGRAAAAMLLDDSREPRRLVLPTRLVVRRTTAPPRQK